MAVAIGVKRRIIFSYEKNETRPSFDVLLAIADYFKVSIDYLIGRSDILLSEPININPSPDFQPKAKTYKESIKDFGKNFTKKIDDFFGLRDFRQEESAFLKRAFLYYFDTFKVYFEPDGMLTYVFINNDEKTLKGSLKYIFGVYLDTRIPQKFLYLEQIEGDLIEKIINSKGQFEFFGLVSLVNSRLMIGYDPIKNYDVSLVINHQGNYKELSIEYGDYSAKTSYIFYEEYIAEWLQKSKDDRINFLNAELYRMGALLKK